MDEHHDFWMANFWCDSRHAFADFGDNFAKKVLFMRMCFFLSDLWKKSMLRSMEIVCVWWKLGGWVGVGVYATCAHMFQQ